MDEFIKAILIQMGIYLGVIIFVFLALNMMSAGFLTKWFRVKTSQGKKVLIKVRGNVQDKFYVGELLEGFVVYKKKNSDGKMEKVRLSMPEKKSVVYRSAGVNVVETDDEKNCLILPNYEFISGFDPEKFEALFVRAMYKPSLANDMIKIILIIVIVIGIAVLFGFYMTRGWIVSHDVLVNAKLDMILNQTAKVIVNQSIGSSNLITG